MSVLQAALIGCVAALSVLEGGWLGESKFREPVVTGALVGLILGDLRQGLIIGAELQLIWMGAVAIGPTPGLSIGTGGTIGTAIALMTGSGIEVAMAFGVPVSILMQFLATLIDTAYSAPMHTVDNLIDEGNQEKKIVFIHYLCGILTFAIYFSLTFVVLYYGNSAIQGIVNNLPAWVNSGLGAVAKVLPALGFALLLNLLLTKDLVPYFVIGFVLAAYMGLSMIAVAAVMIAVAMIMFQIKSGQINVNLQTTNASDVEEL